MDIDVRELDAHAREELFVPSQRQIGIDAALNHDLRRALIGRILHAREHLIVRKRSSFLVMLGPEECAERAVHVADVGVVDRRVDHVGDDARRVQLHPARVRGHAEVVQIGFAIEPHPLVERKAPTRRGAVEQTSERRHR